MALILLAEDDQSMRTFLSRALARAGHRVVEVGDGMAALDRLKAGTFDLLLADVVMPGLDGVELARRAGEIRPAMKVMFITGFAAVALRARERQQAGARVLSKPFHLRELVQEVDAILAA
jgi:two-component system cell cycle response regulator CpdR